MKTGDIVVVNSRSSRRAKKPLRAVLIESDETCFDKTKLWKVVYLGQERLTTSFVMEEMVSPMPNIES
jgi:hypothetical protein